MTLTAVKGEQVRLSEVSTLYISRTYNCPLGCIACVRPGNDRRLTLYDIIPAQIRSTSQHVTLQTNVTWTYGAVTVITAVATVPALTTVLAATRNAPIRLPNVQEPIIACSSKEREEKVQKDHFRGLRIPIVVVQEKK